MLYSSMTEIIGNTPMLELKNYEKKLNLKARVFVKLEALNPAGSAKDRVALSMIEDAEKRGILNENSVIIESTSGNTGIGLAAVCASKGYRAIFTMSEAMSVERQKLLKAFGAEIVLTPAGEGMAGAVAKAEQLAKELPNSFIPAQFDNPANPMAHYSTTGPEIWKDTKGNVDIFVASIGTGGTISGTGKFLKEQKPEIKVVGVEPASSPLITKGVSGPHKIQGIGANFIPNTYDRNICNTVIPVTDEDAYAIGKEFPTVEGVLIGISGGATVWTALQLAQLTENQGKTIVALVTDSGERYMSTTMYD